MPQYLKVKFMLCSRQPLESGLIFQQQKLVTAIGFHVRAFSELIVQSWSYYFHCKTMIF